MNNTIHILDFENSEYIGYPLEKNNKNRKIESIQDFNVMINKGDFYYDDGRSIEIYSPEQKTISLYYIDTSTGKTNSIQFLTECQTREIIIKKPSHDEGHSDVHDHSNSSPHSPTLG